MTVDHSKTQPFILFKGCTRPPLILGVPIVPFLAMLMGVSSCAMLFSLWWWLFALPLWLVMAQLTKMDEKAFRIFGLWVETKLRNRHKAFWGASSYTPTDYRRRR